MKINNQKAASLLLTLLIMAALLAIALGISKLTLGEIRLGRDIPKSIVAYYAAEAGIEQALYEKRINDTNLSISDCPAGGVSLDNESQYGVKLTTIGKNIFIKSIGCYKGITRAIEVSF